ncbi:hypothetical protein SXCC_01850 [Gluconacetobacter sp. SXCC-1]|nr:hypothetical protein SXCC_01850 [Gluconacetobacter sp. SXCC-1]
MNDGPRAVLPPRLPEGGMPRNVRKKSITRTALLSGSPHPVTI